MRVFIAGVMQASNIGRTILDQGYRTQIGAALLQRWPDLDVVDPFALHPDSLGYNDEQARETLFAMAKLAAASDLVIAYLPAASMGTALEMYMAYERAVPVLTISPLAENWVVRALSLRVFPTMEAFLRWLGEVDRLPGLQDVASGSTGAVRGDGHGG
jgi:hypothetical protein